MKRRTVAWLVAGALVAPAALAHHSFAMFDQEHKSEREGVVKEFRFSAPHVFIMLEIKDSEGAPAIWALEGEAPTALVREGWSAKSLQPGDELRLMVAPRRIFAAGGAWVIKDTKFRDGRPIVAHP
jgi:Family of unknown function (DUF6152)